jgi:glycosyltransferase involved in cell wall biosynthesis
MNKGINHFSLSIYTSGGFPYGGPSENFVRMMALGLRRINLYVNIKLLRGNIRNENSNDTGIEAKPVLFYYKPSKEVIKFLEIIILFFFVPFCILSDKRKCKTDAIILYGIDYLYYIIPFLIVSKLLGIKLYRVITDDYIYDTLVPVWWKRPKYYFLEFQAKRIDKHLSGIICLSNYLKQKCLLNGIKDDKILIIPHFIDLEQFRSAAAIKEEFRIGYCGAIVPENGIFILLKAFEIIYKRYNNIQLMILGDIKALNDNDLLLFNDISKKYRHNILIEGEVKYADVPAKLGSCQILVNPRISGKRANAGFPTKLGEYLACSRAVVTTRVGDMSQYFNDKSELMLAEPDSPESIAEKLIWLIENPIQRVQISRKGLEWCINNLHYIKSAEKLADFIIN